MQYQMKSSNWFACVCCFHATVGDSEVDMPAQSFSSERLCVCMAFSEDESEGGRLPTQLVSIFSEW